MARLPPSFKLRSLRAVCRRDALWASEAEGASGTKSDLDLLCSPAKKTTPPLLFPWRHGTELPPRLLQRKDSHQDSLTSYESSALGITTMTAGFYFHEMSFFRLLAGRWRNELAESCSWAFVQGLAGILSNTYHGAWRKCKFVDE